MDSVDTEQQLAWEARQRPRAAIAAIAAGVLTLLGAIIQGRFFVDVPTASVLASLERVGDGAIGQKPSLLIPLAEHYDERGMELLAGVIVNSLGIAALGLVLTFLAFATRARSSQLPRIGLYLPFIGGVLLAIGALLFAIGRLERFDGILDTARTVTAVNDTEAPPLLIAGPLLQFVGGLALAIGFLLTCLHAMRAGLLTRFMGVLGVLLGFLLILPVLGNGAAIVQSFWLVALGLLFLQRVPGGAVPPAWRTGKAEPWPTAAEARAAREAPAAAPAVNGPSPSTSANKRKRKRRG